MVQVEGMRQPPQEIVGVYANSQGERPRVVLAGGELAGKRDLPGPTFALANFMEREWGQDGGQWSPFAFVREELVSVDALDASQRTIIGVTSWLEMKFLNLAHGDLQWLGCTVDNNVRAFMAQQVGVKVVLSRGLRLERGTHAGLLHVLSRRDVSYGLVVSTHRIVEDCCDGCDVRAVGYVHAEGNIVIGNPATQQDKIVLEHLPNNEAGVLQVISREEFATKISWIGKKNRKDSGVMQASATAP